MFRQLNAVLVLMTTSNSPFSAAAAYAATSAWQTITKEFLLMKKTVMCALLVAAMACGGTALYAQTQDNTAPAGSPAAGRRAPMTPEQRLEHMTKALNLSDDQQQKIKPLLDSEQQQMQALRQDTSMSRDDRMAKMQQIRQSTNEQIKPILSGDQQTKWEQMQSRHMQGGGMNQDKPKLQ